MGMLIDGQWRDEDPPAETGKAGHFKRVDSAFRGRITADGSSGFKAEAGRYHLYVAYTLSVGASHADLSRAEETRPAYQRRHRIPGLRQQGWTFEDNPAFPDCTPDRVNGFHYLHEAYAASNPHYTGKVTVPTLWDKKTKRIVNNESSEIIRMLNTEFGAHRRRSDRFLSVALARRDRRVNAQVYANVNNGVYRCGFARSQEAYDEAYDALFATLDEIEARLGRQRYLVGNQITEADWRLFPTLVRFDVAYFSLFKCNRNRIADFPNLLNYVRELYAVPGIAATVKPRYYVMGYYCDHTRQPDRDHSQGHAGRFPEAARPHAFRGVRARLKFTLSQSVACRSGRLRVSRLRSFRTPTVTSHRSTDCIVPNSTIAPLRT